MACNWCGNLRHTFNRFQIKHVEFSFQYKKRHSTYTYTKETFYRTQLMDTSSCSKFLHWAVTQSVGDEKRPALTSLRLMLPSVVIGLFLLSFYYYRLRYIVHACQCPIFIGRVVWTHYLIEINASYCMTEGGNPQFWVEKEQHRFNEIMFECIEHISDIDL